RTTSEKAHESTDAQLIATYLVRDAQSAGGSNPGTGLPDPSLGVGTDAAGCGSSTGLVVRFKWIDRSQLGPQYVHTNVATYTVDSVTHGLTRHLCVDGGTAADVTLGTRVASAVCSSPSPCTGFPRSVTLQLTATNNPPNGSTFNYSLSAALRSQSEDFPDTGTASRVLIALMALGNPTCLNGTTGVAASGHPNVTVYGNVIDDGVDAPGCTALSVSGGAQLAVSGGTKQVAPGGTCSGTSGCITLPGPLNDPFATLPPPAGTCGAGPNPPLAGGHYQPGVYRTDPAITVTAIFDSGVYFFCNGFSASAAANLSGNGVLFYVAGGALSISGQSEVTLTSAISGPYANVLLWVKTAQTFAVGGGTSVQSYAGFLYAPLSQVQLTGGSGAVLGGIIAKTIVFLGGGGGGQFTLGSPPVSVTTTSLKAATQGQIGYSQTLASTGGTAPITWSITSGSLPNGLTLDAAAGVISGNVSGTATSQTFTVRATDADGNAGTKSLTITVNPPPSVTTTSLIGGADGSLYSEALGAGGGTGGYTWSLASGALPTWATLDTSTGVISGTPNGTGTTSGLRFRVRDSNNVAATSASLSITITNPGTTVTVTETAGSGQKEVFSGTTTGNTGTLTVNIYAGSAASGAMVQTYSTTTFFGAASPFNWSITTGNELTAGSTYTARATQVDGTGNNSTNAPTVTFIAN
ncbi:MAG: Ig domain-containing protein, partial [Acidimicrobiales bacterium]